MKFRNQAIELSHWHLRAFWGELVAARDAARRSPHPEKKREANALDDQAWFQEVNAYRNFAHQSYHLVEVLFSEGKVRRRSVTAGT
jgi:hypothetical protein